VPWSPQPGTSDADLVLYGVAVVERREGNVVFVSTDSQVYASTDDGVTWHVVSDGLPARAHCADLVTGPGDAPGVEWLYLGTFGRSMWRADVGHLDHG
jgi:hypothetical protein